MLVEKLAAICSSWQDFILRLFFYLTIQMMAIDNALTLIPVAVALDSISMAPNRNPKPNFLFYGIYGILVENDRMFACHLWQMPFAFYLPTLETWRTVCVLMFIKTVMQDIPAQILVNEPLAICLFVCWLHLLLVPPS